MSRILTRDSVLNIRKNENSIVLGRLKFNYLNEHYWQKIQYSSVVMFSRCTDKVSVWQTQAYTIITSLQI